MTLLLLTLTSLVWAQDEEPVTEEGTEVVEEVDPFRDISFEHDLYMNTDMMLQGLTPYGGITFTRPKNWELTHAPVMEIRFDHSAALLPERSSLTVFVNDTALASVELTEDNVLDGRVRVSIPPSLVTDYNAVRFEVNQHVDEECEDPFDPSLWTRVSNDSFVRMFYDVLPVEEELLHFPFPVHDELGYGPTTVALVGPKKVSAAAVEALGELGFALGRTAAFRNVAVADPVAYPDQATTHGIVIGTPAENPLVSQLVDTSGLSAGHGLVAMLQNPTHPDLALLVVTGKDADGLMNAAKALAGQDRFELLSGQASKVITVVDPAPTPTRRDPLPAPPVERFTLADLDIEDRTVRGYYAPRISLPLQLEGDAHARFDGAELALDHAYSAQLDERLSTLEVRLNGVSLRSFPLDEVGGEQKQRVYIDLPFELMQPDSTLDLVYHLFPIDFDPCRRISDRMIWGTVFASTELTIGRDHYAELPDLSLLKHDLWPFTLADRDGGLRVVVSQEPTNHDAGAAFLAAAQFGRSSTSDHPDFGVVTSDASVLRENRHLVVLASDSPNSTYDALVKSRSISMPGDLERKLLGGSTDLLNAQVQTHYGTLEAAVHPSFSDRSVLVARAPKARDLDEVVDVIGDKSRLYQLAGNAAIIAAGGEPRAGDGLDVADKVQVGVIPLSTRFQMALRKSWFIIGAMVLLAALVLAAAIRLWAGSRGGQA